MTHVPPETPERLRNWGLHAVTSPLYHHLIEVIARDDDLLRVINRIKNVPRPNVLFGAVHYLMLKGADHELARFYGSLVTSPRSPSGAGRPFKDFVLTYEEEISEIGRTRLTQTNECRRCVSLLLGVMATGIGRFHLIEIGASAGLNLALDRYRYSWNGVEWGPQSAVKLETDLSGTLPPVRPIEVLSRTGLDLNPVDPSDAEDRRWLEALIWPEHEERRKRLQAALSLTAGLDIELLAGDATETLEPAITALHGPEPAVVMDSFTLNQFTKRARGQIEKVIRTAREWRQIARVSLEPLTAEAAASLKIDTGDGWRDLARMHHHGEWVEFYARP